MSEKLEPTALAPTEEVREELERYRAEEQKLASPWYVRALRRVDRSVQDDKFAGSGVLIVFVVSLFSLIVTKSWWNIGLLVTSTIVLFFSGPTRKALDRRHRKFLEKKKALLSPTAVHCLEATPKIEALEKELQQLEATQQQQGETIAKIKNELMELRRKNGYR